VGDGASTQGLTTVVFVDVEGSTSLLDRVGDRTGLASVARQLDAVSELVAEYGGQAVKSTGDGLLITFASPRQAVLFAVASQRRLAGSAPRVRIGINTGEADRIDGDPLGAAVNAAARIAARADGGEVLVSEVVRLLTGSAAPVRFVDRGRCRLRGFADRWHLWAAEAGVEPHREPTTIGRGLELTALDELVVSTAAGEGRVVLVEGEAGIGKTHLVREAVGRATRATLGVIEIGADEVVHRPGAIAHGLVAAAPDRLVGRAHLADLLEVDPRRLASGGDLGYAVIEASVDLLEELARSRPLLLVAEDLHWADDLSVKVLTAIVARAAVSRFGVLASIRPMPRSPTLDRFVERVREGAGIRLRIGSLGELDVQALASSITGGAPGERLRRRLEATGGNPLYVTELLRSMDDDAALRVDAGVVEVVVDDTPTDLHETLVRRLSWLPPETNEVMRIASLLGGAFTLQDVATITARSVVDVAAALRDAALAGLVIGDGERLRFRHELVREAVYHHMLPAERRDLHRAAAHSLASAGAPTQQIAEQYARGALPGDVEAVRWLEQAADEAVALEPGSALSMLERASVLAPAPERPGIRGRMIESLVTLGRLDEAEAIASSILGAAPPPDLEYRALRGLLLVHRAQGAFVEAYDAMTRAADAPGAPADERRRLRCICAHYSMLLGSFDVEETRLVVGEVLGEALAAGDLATQCVAEHGLGLIAMMTGHVQASQDHLTRAMALFDSGRIPPATFVYSLPHTLHALNLLELDDLDGAIAASNRVRAQSDAIGVVSPLPLALGVAAIARFCSGQWDDAIADAEAAGSLLDLNVRGGVLIDALLAAIACHRGDLSATKDHLGAGEDHQVAGTAGFGTDWLLMARAEYLKALGRPDEAFQLAATSWAATSHLRYMIGYRSQGVLLVQLALAVGREDAARAVTDELDEGARRTPADSARGAALRARGLVERDPEALLGAAEHYRRTARRPELAGCCEDAARLLDETGRRDDAVALLNEAAAIYADVDAAGDTQRVDLALRRLGVRPRRSRRVRPAFGWESLTRMESDVVALVGDGLTNPEIGARLFISRRTVESHLGHVFRKLDVRNRAQLVAAFAKRPR
jgi:class 3 adenylate cyclase/DNA-binding CsgD family transcriptional regulator/tetratricopeptide (TPR) repeat protein